MYKSKHIIGKRNGKIHRFALFFTVLMLLCGVLSLFHFTPSHVSADEDSNVNKLQNGSFEEGQSWTDKKYKQPDQSEVPAWNTTAFEGKIELFRENTGTYIGGVTLKPTNGEYAAELNADEESTLYQNVKTTPSSVYEWGLDHGGRNGTDTMALVIGPKQSVDPSKPNKAGRDQFMQMVDWLIAQGMTSFKTSAGLGEQLTVFSKKFAASGAFEDNAGNNAFSLTPSTIYTEEWHIWIMASSKATSGTNPWSHYGSNAEGSAESGSGTGNTEIDLSKYYLYTVPAGQTETLFGFVSVGYVNSPVSADKAKTYGNFLDNINFQIYHPLSGSTTTHGSAVIGGSDGTTGGTGSSKGHEVTIDNKLTTYVTDGEPLKIQAIVKAADVTDGCEFVGVYYTKQDENGNPVTDFLKLAGNEIDYSEDLTDEQKAGKWIKSTNTDGDVIYTYYLDGVTSATDLHFVFVKSPTVTYDPNGGKEYKVYEGEREYNTDEADNVYSFKPVTGIDEAQAGTKTLFIDPYVSHAAEGQNDGWKFMGWLLTGDIVDNVSADNQINADQLGSMILPAEHTVACDYTFDGVNGNTKAQYFKIYNGNVALTKRINQNEENNEDVGVTWINNSEKTISYANVHKGLTMVAQWRWRQAFIPQTYNNSLKVYDYSDTGGTVEITSVTDTSDTNYNAAYNENGGKSYHAATGERVTVTATAKEGYNFVGWYDESGKLIATNAEYSYVETQESVKTYYARFSNSVTQTYIRQVGSGDNWTNTTDDKIGTLGRYSYTDAVGMPISSTATAGNDYKFMGWYDSDGNKVAGDMLINGGATISYTTTGNATYYARFSKLIKQTYVRQIGSGDNWKNTNDDTIGTLTHYSQTNTADATVSSQAKAGKYYEFVGWYASDGTLITTNKTISGTITEGATYYARFSKKIVTQTFIRQVKNGDSWVEITDDEIGYLSLYYHNGEVQQTVDSKATAGSGYRFVGWYDSEGNDANKVIDDMLTDNGMTISYTTTGNATYYARFEKAYTLNVSKLDGDQSTDENKVPLAGAEFTLYQVDSNGDKTITYNGESIKCVSVGVVVTALSEDKTKATAVFTDTLSPDSVYYLAETKAPTGYRLLDAPLKIIVDDSGNIARIDEKEKNITENEVNVELANYLTLHMPTSGTPFTGGLFAVAGLSLLALAAIGLFWFKISRYKSKNK
ncbi:prealbumin-like fold domain-containing protein [uncultured Ruminococcus sp.]|uniref:prealbumin-like fold domain-containing protein n=1 Tax=uncultured Ruminococcus sp. TaxID=165186 RepID=UPI00260B6817|nr:prealbumin-like fold domain-containing protein [uncultured Ruminococcus sp.]